MTPKCAGINHLMIPYKVVIFCMDSKDDMDAKIIFSFKFFCKLL
jgi:hypothetical protein